MTTFSRFVGITVKIVVIVFLFSFLFVGIYNVVVKKTGEEIQATGMKSKQVIREVKLPPRSNFVNIVTTDNINNTVVELEVPENVTIGDIEGKIDVTITIESMRTINITYTDSKGMSHTVRLTPTYMGDSYSIFTFEEYNVMVQPGKIAKKLRVNTKIVKNELGLVYINNKEVRNKYIVWVDCYMKLQH